MMENQVTSVEQSKRMLELGVPAEKASMVWCQNVLSFADGIDYEAANKAGAEIVPAFTVSDLLGMIPTSIVNNDGIILDLVLDHYNGTMHLSYQSRFKGEDYAAYHFRKYINFNLIDSAVECIEWLAKNNNLWPSETF